MWSRNKKILELLKELNAASGGGVGGTTTSSSSSSSANGASSEVHFEDLNFVQQSYITREDNIFHLRIFLMQINENYGIQQSSIPSSNPMASSSTLAVWQNQSELRAVINQIQNLERYRQDQENALASKHQMINNRGSVSTTTGNGGTSSKALAVHGCMKQLGFKIFSKIHKLNLAYLAKIQMFFPRLYEIICSEQVAQNTSMRESATLLISSPGLTMSKIYAHIVKLGRQRLAREITKLNSYFTSYPGLNLERNRTNKNDRFYSERLLQGQDSFSYVVSLQRKFFLRPVAVTKKPPLNCGIASSSIGYGTHASLYEDILNIEKRKQGGAGGNNTSDFVSALNQNGGNQAIAPFSFSGKEHESILEIILSNYEKLLKDWMVSNKSISSKIKSYSQNSIKISAALHNKDHPLHSLIAVSSTKSFTKMPIQVSTSNLNPVQRPSLQGSSLVYRNSQSTASNSQTLSRQTTVLSLQLQPEAYPLKFQESAVLQQRMSCQNIRIGGESFISNRLNNNNKDTTLFQEHTRRNQGYQYEQQSKQQTQQFVKHQQQTSFSSSSSSSDVYEFESGRHDLLQKNMNSIASCKDLISFQPSYAVLQSELHFEPNESLQFQSESTQQIEYQKASPYIEIDQYPGVGMIPQEEKEFQVQKRTQLTSNQTSFDQFRSSKLQLIKRIPITFADPTLRSSQQQQQQQQQQQLMQSSASYLQKQNQQKLLAEQESYKIPQNKHRRIQVDDAMIYEPKAIYDSGNPKGITVNSRESEWPSQSSSILLQADKQNSNFQHHQQQHFQSKREKNNELLQITQVAQSHTFPIVSASSGSPKNGSQKSHQQFISLANNNNSSTTSFTRKNGEPVGYRSNNTTTSQFFSSNSTNNNSQTNLIYANSNCHNSGSLNKNHSTTSHLNPPNQSNQTSYQVSLRAIHPIINQAPTHQKRAKQMQQIALVGTNIQNIQEEQNQNSKNELMQQGNPLLPHTRIARQNQLLIQSQQYTNMVQSNIIASNYQSMEATQYQQQSMKSQVFSTNDMYNSNQLKSRSSGTSQTQSQNLRVSTVKYPYKVEGISSGQAQNTCGDFREGEEGKVQILSDQHRFSNYQSNVDTSKPFMSNRGLNHQNDIEREGIILNIPKKQLVIGIVENASGIKKSELRHHASFKQLPMTNVNASSLVSDRVKKGGDDFKQQQLDRLEIQDNRETSSALPGFRQSTVVTPPHTFRGFGNGIGVETNEYGRNMNGRTKAIKLEGSEDKTENTFSKQFVISPLKKVMLLKSDRDSFTSHKVKSDFQEIGLFVKVKSSK